MLTVLSSADGLPPLLPSPSILAVVVVSLLAVYLFPYRHRQAIGCNARPDLYEPNEKTFLLGHLPEVLKNKGRFLELWERWKAETPAGQTLSITIPFRRLVDCSTPDSLEYIQKQNFPNFVKGKVAHERMSTILGDGIFTVDGHAWHQQRKVTSKVFTPTLFRTAISSSISSNLAKLVAMIERHSEKGDEFDLSDLFFRYTLSAFADFGFSTDVKALPAVEAGEKEVSEPVPFAKAFDQAQVLIEGRFTNPAWKMTEPFNGTTKAFAKSRKVIDDFVYGIIDEREAEGKNSVTKEEKKEAQKMDLLSLYLALEDEQGQKLSKEHVRDASLNLLLAGRDTTAEALSWCSYHLFSNESGEYWQSIRKEADELGEVTYDNHKSFVYTTAVFMENGWTALQDDQLPNGTHLEAGDVTFWSDWTMARDESIWGEDAKVFKPSRWIDEDGELRKESQFKAHMFNGGQRLCLGQTLATLETVSCLSLLSRVFDFRLPPSYFERTEFLRSPYGAGEVSKAPRYKGALTLFMEKPLVVTARKREA